MAATWGYSSIGKCRILCRWVHWISNFHVRVWLGRGSLLSDAVWLGEGRGQSGTSSLIGREVTNSGSDWLVTPVGPNWHDIWREVSITASLSQSNAVCLVPVKSPQRAPGQANTRYQIFKRLSRVFTLSRDWMVTSHSIINTQCIKFLGQSRLVNDSQI